MEGAPAQFVNQGLETMIAEMAMLAGGNKKPYFKVSLISFGSVANRLVTAESPADLEMRLSSVANFAGNSGTTNMAAAFQEAEQLLRSNPGAPTDYQPWVFLFSDGRPDDANAALSAAESLKRLSIAAGSPFFVSFGFGQVDDGFMTQVCSNSEAYARMNGPQDLLKVLPAIGTVAKSAANSQQLLQGIQTQF
jgi:uncharacterized protein YegL